MPRYAVFVLAAPASEAGSPPPTALLSAMAAYNERLLAAGVLVSAEGLQPSSQGARLTFQGAPEPDSEGSARRPAPQIVRGPFTGTLVAGFWILEAESVEVAIEWAGKAPMLEGDVLEVRPVQGVDDFGGEMTGELREGEERLRRKLEEKK